MSEFEFANSGTGKDDVLFILGVKIFENDHDREIDSLSRVTTVEEPESVLAALSTSDLEPQCLKLNFGRILLMDEIPLVEEGSDSCSNESEGLGVKKKFTLLGVGVSVGGIFI